MERTAQAGCAERLRGDQAQGLHLLGDRAERRPPHLGHPEEHPERARRLGARQGNSVLFSFSG